MRNMVSELFFDASESGWNRSVHALTDPPELMFAITVSRKRTVRYRQVDLRHIARILGFQHCVVGRRKCAESGNPGKEIQDLE
jgi:hypothetical protein